MFSPDNLNIKILDIKLAKNNNSKEIKLNWFFSLRFPIYRFNNIICEQFCLLFG